MLLIGSGLAKDPAALLLQLWITIGKRRPCDDIRHFQAIFRALLVSPTFTALPLVKMSKEWELRLLANHDSLRAANPISATMYIV